MTVLLETQLKFLKSYLTKKDLVEISINQPGEVWLESAAGGWQRKTDKELTRQRLINLCELLATEQGQDFSDEVPMLATTIPSYGFRIQAVSGSAVESGFALSIRIAANKELALSAWFKPAEIEQLRCYIEQRKTILVSGGTGSGKTTLLNSLLREIDESDRIVVLEDSKELIIEQPNRVRLLKSKTGTDIANLSYKDFINAIMRLRPDRILLGEIDIENTPNFLRLINTGHDGTFATIHASSIKGAADALVENCKLNGMGGNDETIKNYVMKYIDVIVQVKRTIVSGKRTFSAHFEAVRQ